MTNPTFVFSTGAWIRSEFFDEIRSKLIALGFPTECKSHPSIGAEPPTKTLADDTASQRDFLTQLADEGRDLIVVAHSYGGVVTSSSVEGLDKATREKEGKTGGVVKVVYMAAFALDKGNSLLDMLGGKPLPFMHIDGDYVRFVGDATTNPWLDIPEEDQQKWGALTTHTSRLVFGGECTYEPWHDIPSAYIICEKDQNLPPPLQELFAAKLAGPDKTFRLPSSHSPFLSMPDRLAEILQKIAKE
ncbi:hypothetical protein N7495_009656 [Penicillium taxi]|uniref:uncharacterized protein n=1 Tax=Penicillium taxi TaxID=168475 RepID=UPI0025457612|nr:uncharacterized protein N7495_009656 [Penicillium taxi]KAJ5885146.1 hypothetical protein N7495_009656 [Penicillium taxi]